MVVASIVVSCGSQIGEADRLDLDKTPTQRIFDMFAVQTRNGSVSMRIESDLMEHYDADTASYDAFPHGISVYGYTDEGLLESVIVADDARHIVPKDRKGNIHGLLCQDVLPPGFPAGVRNAFRRPRTQLDPVPSVRRVRGRRAG